MSDSEVGYRVRWEIDIYATSPRQAAEKAHAIMLDGDSLATVFTVIDGAAGEFKVIDLLDESTAGDSAVHCPDCGLPHDFVTCARLAASCSCCSAMFPSPEQRAVAAELLDES